MHDRHKIVFFVRQNNDCPVQNYLFDDNDLTRFEIIINAMQYLALVGSAIFDTKMATQFNDHKPLCELRKDRHRIFFAEDKILNHYIMLAAFIKKSQKTPPEELAQAERYWQEYLKYKRVNEFEIPLDIDLANL